MKGQTALVTGASQGLADRAIALRLAREGAAIGVNYVTRDDLAEEVALRRFVPPVGERSPCAPTLATRSRIGIWLTA